MNELGAKNSRKKKGDRASSLGRREVLLVELTLLLPSHVLLFFSEAVWGVRARRTWGHVITGKLCQSARRRLGLGANLSEMLREALNCL